MIDITDSPSIFDLHIHSIYSQDSILKPERIIKIAKKKGLSGIAVTDHNTIKGAIKTKSVVPDGDFMVIVGAEIKTDKGEVIGLFLSEEIKSGEFVEVIEEIKDQDGITVLPHPYRNRLCNPEDLLKKVDLVEGLNARTAKKLNQKAQVSAKKFEVPIIAGSDAHTYFEIGQAQTIIEENDLAFDSIKACLLKGEVSIAGSEAPHHLRMMSVGIGKIRRDGTVGFVKSCINKVLNKRSK